MKRLLALVGLLAVLCVSGASAEDGAPVVGKPASCVSVDLSGGEDYSSPYTVDVIECVDGGSGANAMWLEGGRDWANGKGGSDGLRGGDDGDTLWGGNEGDSIYGDGGDDFLYAGCPGGCDQSGAKAYNALHGGPGDDVLAMANGVANDVADCGSGSADKVYFDKGIDNIQGDCEWKSPQLVARRLVINGDRTSMPRPLNRISIDAALESTHLYPCFGEPAALASAASEFPEPRVFTETQGWWVDAKDTGGIIPLAPTDDFPFISYHVHLGVCFPIGEELVIPPAGEGYRWDYLAQAHEQIGGKVRGVRGGGGVGTNVGDLNYDPDFHGDVFDAPDYPHVGFIPHGTGTPDAWRALSPRVTEFRFTFDITSLFGKRQYQSGAWLASLNQPGSPVRVTARGWYEGPGYTNITLQNRVTASQLASTGLHSTLSYALAQGATRAFAYIDADIHHGSKGTVLFENRTGSSGSFTLPALSPGTHVLLLGGWEKAGSGWNAGVLRLPFNVN